VTYQVKTEAFVLNKEPGWKDEGYLLLFSKNYGLIRVTAGGVLKQTAKLSALTEPPVLAECNLTGTNGKMPSRLTTLSVKSFYENIRESYDNYSWYAFSVFMLRNFLYHQTPNTRMYSVWKEFLSSSKDWSKGKYRDTAFIYFLLRLIEEEGVCPLWNICSSCQKDWMDEEDSVFFSGEESLLCKDCAKLLQNENTQELSLDFLSVLPEKDHFTVPKGFLRITSNMRKVLQTIQKEGTLEQTFTNIFSKDKIDSQTIGKTRNFLLIFSAYLI